MTPRRARGPDRRRHARRKSDVWKSAGRLAGLVASVTGAIIGQGHLIGDPLKHYVTIVFVGCTAAFGFLLGPDHLKTLSRHFKGVKL